MHLRQIITFALLCAICCVGRVALAATAATPLVYDIPRLDKISIDGNGDDWGMRGFRVNAFKDVSEALLDSPRTALSDVTMRLGWDDRGLLLLINVVDVSPMEDNDPASIWRKDSVELYMGEKLGGKDHYQLLVSPGVDGKHAEIRHYFYDFRSSAALKAVPLTCSVARTKTANGYVIEALMPWENLHITPALGREVSVQVMVNDFDPQGSLWHKLWYPLPGAAFFPDRYYTVRLAETPSAPVKLQAYCYHEHFHRLVVSAIGTADQVGKALLVREGRRLLGHAKMARAANGRSVAEVLLPLAPNSPHFGALTALIDGEQFTLDPAPIYLERLKTIMRLKVVPSTSAFIGTGFPSCDFSNAEQAENLLGRYTLRTSYYDAAYHQVNSAEAPGRYGALVEATTEDGKTYRHYVTLYRLPEQEQAAPRGRERNTEDTGDLREKRVAGVIQALLQELKLQQPAFQEQFATVADLYYRTQGAFARQPECAVFLAGLSEMAPGEARATSYTGVESRDARWWYGLRQHLGISETYPYVIQYPEGYGTDKTIRYPLIISLHGSLDGNIDFDAFKKKPIDAGLSAAAKAKYPSIVVAPFSQVGGWSPEKIDATLAELLAREPVDPDRVYLTGLSMGGFGTWITAAAYPERYAAVVPIAGGGDTHDAARLKDLPIWAFHGEVDNVVNPAFSKDMVNAVTQAGGHPQLTLYPGIGHGSWGPAYADPKLYDWLFQQRRGQAGAGG